MRACDDIVKYKNEINDKKELECTLSASMFEIYNDQVHDLLEEGNRNLQLREKTNEGVYVAGLSDRKVQTTQDVLDTINLGFELRSTASTNMNSESSRSHCIVNIVLEQRNPTTGFLKTSKLYLVDLAGSEKVKKTGATGSTLKEATAINKSLSALGKIISLLSKVNMDEQKKKKSPRKDNKNNRKNSGTHIPYRDSKLTRILQNSLGGNAKTALLVACSPHDDNYEETLSTLKFAKRARSIKNMTRVQAKKGSSFKKSATSKAGLLKEIDELKALENEIKEMLEIINSPKYDAEKTDKREKFEKILIETERLCGKPVMLSPRSTGTDGKGGVNKYRRRKKKR